MNGQGIGLSLRICKMANCGMCNAGNKKLVKRFYEDYKIYVCLYCAKIKAHLLFEEAKTPVEL